METTTTNDRVLKLTKRTIEALPVDKPETYRDIGDRFLHLVVLPSGRRVWRFIRKVSGRTRFYTLGTYPDMTPEVARRESARVSAEYNAGHDPAEAKQKLRHLLTWADLFNWYVENHSKPHKRTWQADVKMEGRYCASWRGRPYTTITTDVITRWHKQIGQQKGRHAADRVLALVKSVYSEGIAAGVIQGANPAAVVHKFYTDPRQYGRERFLSGDELGRLLKALDEYYDRDMADFFMVALLTAARRGNVQSMRWQDMDRSDPANPKWVIPAEESKNREPMTIPLLEPVLQILNRRYETRRSDIWVFPAKRRGAKTPHLSEPKKAWAQICKAAEIQNVRIHDLRRTMGSWQALLGASLMIIGRSLGHKSMKSTEVYARLDLDPVRASMSKATAAMLAAGKDATP